MLAEGRLVSLNFGRLSLMFFNIGNNYLGVLEPELNLVPELILVQIFKAKVHAGFSYTIAPLKAPPAFLK